MVRPKLGAFEEVTVPVADDDFEPATTYVEGAVVGQGVPVPVQAPPKPNRGVIEGVRGRNDPKRTKRWGFEPRELREPEPPPPEPEVDLGPKVFVSSSEMLNGALRWQSTDKRFVPIAEKYLGVDDCMSNWTHMLDLVSDISTSGLEVVFDDRALERYGRVTQLLTQPFELDAPWFATHSLYPFQHAGANLASDSEHEESERVLANWDTGAGKTVLGAIVARKLLNMGVIDRVIVVARRAKKRDWANFFESAVGLESVTMDKQNRRKRYELYCSKPQVIVTNYEKLRYPKVKGRKKADIDWGTTDVHWVVETIDGDRVLFILDECHIIANRNTLVSRGIKYATTPPKVTKKGRKSGPGPEVVRVLGLTATPFWRSPEDYRDIFHVLAPKLPLVSGGTKKDFIKEYAVSGGMWHPDEDYVPKAVWDEERKLPRLGYRISGRTHMAPKSDPLIAAQFPTMTERLIEIDMSDHDAGVYGHLADILYDRWEAEFGDNASALAAFQLMRMVCNTTESLTFSQSELAATMAAQLTGLDTHRSSKYQAVLDLVRTVLESDDKIVLFSFWANAVIGPYTDQLRRDLGDDVPIFSYTGGMKTEEQDAAVQAFNEVSGGGLIVMSDAGAEGLNLYAPYLAHVEMPYTYLTYKQRWSRIHRADSKDHGIDHIWVYRFLTNETVEEMVETRVQQRRAQAEAIAGQADVTSITETWTREEIAKALFGKRNKAAA